MKRRFIYKLILFLLLAYLVPALYIEFGGMNFYNREYPMWMYKKLKYETKSEQYHETLIMGDSRIMAGVQPLVISPTALSLAIGGSSSIEAYYILKHYLENNKAPKQILFSVTPVHFQSQPYFWLRDIKYKFLPIKDTMEIFARSAKLKSCPFGCESGKYAKYKYYWKYFKHRINLAHLYRPELVKSRLFNRRAENLERWNSLVENNGHSFFGTLKRANGVIQEIARKDFGAYKLLDSYTKDFMDLARKNNIQVIYITVAVSDRSYRLVKDIYFKGYLKFLRSYQHKYPEFIFDFSWPQYTEDHFGDSSHLNAFGSKKYSNYIRQRYFTEGPVEPKILQQQQKWQVVLKSDKKKKHKKAI